ncbi:hypothetical protein MRX96_043776 [Rhipicephalus microplus]
MHVFYSLITAPEHWQDHVKEQMPPADETPALAKSSASQSPGTLPPWSHVDHPDNPYPTLLQEESEQLSHFCHITDPPGGTLAVFSEYSARGRVTSSQQQLINAPPHPGLFSGHGGSVAATMFNRNIFFLAQIFSIAVTGHASPWSHVDHPDNPYPTLLQEESEQLSHFCHITDPPGGDARRLFRVQRQGPSEVITTAAHKCTTASRTLQWARRQRGCNDVQPEHFFLGAG